MRKIFLLLVLVFSVAMVWAENYYAINARAEQVERKIVITYDLSKTANVRLLMATDMSNDFKELKKVTGHVGKNVQAGANRRITWNVLEEFDRFVADGVRFKVEAVSPIPLKVSESQITTTAAGVTKYITVTCDKPWEIQCSSATMYSATRSGSSVKVVVYPNTSTSARNDYFYIRTTDESEKVKISLLQSGKSSTTSSSSSSSSHNARNGIQAGHEYVDLGLSVKWATCNVGANRPEEYGSYFAWGETQPKSTYDWLTYKWCKRTYADLTKYCTTTRCGIVDNKTILELIDDAARANWGGSWRMPTKAEQEELRTKCTWTWTTQNGVNGYKVTSKSNGNSIFLPAAGYRNDKSLNSVGGYGGYWLCSLNEFSSSSQADLFGFDSYNASRVGYGDRKIGRSVRPVCP